MNKLNNTDSNPPVQTTDVRLHYAAPQLVTFGAIRDLTAGGSAGLAELGSPGDGRKMGFHS